MTPETRWQRLIRWIADRLYSWLPHEPATCTAPSQTATTGRTAGVPNRRSNGEPRATIRIRYQEPPDIPWTAQADLVPGHPYTYATAGLLVTVDWAAIEEEARAVPAEDGLREARQAISRAHGSLHLGNYDDVDAALEAARAALASTERAAGEPGVRRKITVRPDGVIDEEHEFTAEAWSRLSGAARSSGELDALADDVRYAGGHETSDYWRGLNDGIDKFVARLREPRQTETGE